jgi:hypothetical protein
LKPFDIRKFALKHLETDSASDIGHILTHQQSSALASLALAVPSRCSQTSIGNATNGSADLGKRISKIQQEDKSGLVTL